MMIEAGYEYEGSAAAVTEHIIFITYVATGIDR